MCEAKRRLSRFRSALAAEVCVRTEPCVNVAPMKSAAPNPHPEHMFNILWCTETQLRIRERSSGEREQ